jgi:hypothetical protein
MPAVPASIDIDPTSKALERVSIDEDRAFDTIAGGLIRTFARLNAVVSAYRRLAARVIALEDKPAPAPEGTRAGLARVKAIGTPDRRGSSPASRLAHRLANGNAE